MDHSRPFPFPLSIKLIRIACTTQQLARMRNTEQGISKINQILLVIFIE